MGIINSKHLFFIYTSLAVVTLKTFPTAFMKLGGRDTWLATVIASIFILLFIWSILFINKKTDNYNLLDIYSNTLGKWMGGFFSFLFFLTLLLTLFESAGGEANVMHTHFHIMTPVWVFIGVTAISAVYIVKKGISSVVVISIIVIFFISLSGMLLASLTQKYKQIKYLFPMMEHGITMDFSLSTLKILGAYSCVSIAIPYFASIRDRSKLTKHSMIALLFIIQMEIVSMLGIITTFGPDRAEQLLFPKLKQTQLISIFGFLEAGELFVMLQVVAGWFIRYVVSFFALMELIRLSGLKIRFKEYYVCILTVVFSYLFSKDLFDMFNLLDYLLYIQLVNFLVIPLLIYAIYYVKYKMKNKKASPTVQEGCGK